MVKRFRHTVLPQSKDQYYVYALFKPHDYNPFYIGKGKGDRINSHFKECNLKVNSPKVGIIKKYGNSIRREILCYFSSESDAYAFEEYLIALYGLIEDGGHLVNYAKTRFQYSERFKVDAAKKGSKARPRTHSIETIYKVLDMFYKMHCTPLDISKETGLSQNYIPYVIKGHKCKYEYENYMKDNPSIAENKDSIYCEITRKSFANASKVKQSVSDDNLIESFNKICNGDSSLHEEALRLNYTANYLYSVFKGVKRKNLNLDFSRYPKPSNHKSLDHAEILNQVEVLLNQNYTVSQIVDKTGFGRTTVFRAKKEIVASKSIGGSIAKYNY